MKILITESQYKMLMEQKSDFAYDRQSNALMNATGIRSNADYKTVNTLTNNSQKKLTSPNLDKHDLATVLQIVTVFIPYVGPLISSGIGYLDAKNYWDEGKKQDAALVAVLSSLPAIGAVVSKIPGVKQLGKLKIVDGADATARQVPQVDYLVDKRTQ